MAKRWASHHDAYQPIYRFTIFIASLFDVCFTVPLPSSFIPSCPLLVETRSGGYTAGGKDDDLFQHNIAPPPPRSPQLDGKRFHGQNRVRILSNEYAYTVSVSARRRTINRGDVRGDHSASPSPYKHHRRRRRPPPLLFLFLSGTQGRVIGESYAKGRRTCRSTERPLRTGIVRKRAD